MSIMSCFKVNRSFRSLKQMFSRYLEINSSDSRLIEQLVVMNGLGKFWSVCNRGYSQRGSISLRRKLVNLALDGLSALVVGYIVFLAISASSRQRSVQIMTSVFILINFIGIRWAAIYCEYNDQFTLLRLFERIILDGSLNEPRTLLGPERCSLFAKTVFLLIKFYILGTTACGLGLCVYLSIAVLGIDWTIFLVDFSSPLYVFQLTSVISVIITMIFLLHNVFWCFTHVIIFMVYSCLALDHTSSEMSGQLKGSLELRRDYSSSCPCSAYWLRSNYCYNQVIITNHQLSPITFYGFLLGCFGTDFALFTGVIYGTGKPSLNFIITTLGLFAVGILAMLNMTAAHAIRKINLCQILNFRVSRFCKCPIESLNTLQRMQIKPIGFYVGHLFLMDNYRFLVFLLENGSLLLLFVTNLA